MRLLIVPSIRSRRAVPNGGPHLSVAVDLTSFIRFFECYKLWPDFWIEVDGDNHFGSTIGFSSGLTQSVIRPKASL